MQLSDYSRAQIARLMFEKGAAFMGAAALVDKHDGHPTVVVHLLCQGVEIILKAVLLHVDYDKYRPRLKKLGHRLSDIAAEVRSATGLHVFTRSAGDELAQLEVYYVKHLLRYAHTFDILFDTRTIPCQRVALHTLALMRLCRRVNGTRNV